MRKIFSNHLFYISNHRGVVIKLMKFVAFNYEHLLILFLETIKMCFIEKCHITDNKKLISHVPGLVDGKHVVDGRDKSCLVGKKTPEICIL